MCVYVPPIHADSFVNAQMHTHMHTHTHIYRYIYVYNLISQRLVSNSSNRKRLLLSY